MGLDALVSFLFAFLISLPVFILSLNQSSIDQSNGLSIIYCIMFFLSFAFFSFNLSVFFPSCLPVFVCNFSKASVSSQKNSFPLYSIPSAALCFYFCCFLPLALTRNSWSRFRPREMFSFILDLSTNKRDCMKVSNSCGAIAGTRALSFFLEYLVFARMSTN